MKELLPCAILASYFVAVESSFGLRYCMFPFSACLRENQRCACALCLSDFRLKFLHGIEELENCTLCFNWDFVQGSGAELSYPKKVAGRRRTALKCSHRAHTPDFFA